MHINGNPLNMDRNLLKTIQIKWKPIEITLNSDGIQQNLCGSHENPLKLYKIKRNSQNPYKLHEDVWNYMEVQRNALKTNQNYMQTLRNYHMNISGNYTEIHQNSRKLHENYENYTELLKFIKIKRNYM